MDFTLYLNDRFELDGRDPNGYVGVMWSIGRVHTFIFLVDLNCSVLGGTHDMGWKERPIFGKVRYMNYQGCLRKFDVPSFVRKYPLAKQNAILVKQQRGLT